MTPECFLKADFYKVKQRREYDPTCGLQWYVSIKPEQPLLYKRCLSQYFSVKLKWLLFCLIGLRRGSLIQTKSTVGVHQGQNRHSIITRTPGGSLNKSDKRGAKSINREVLMRCYIKLLIGRASVNSAATGFCENLLERDRWDKVTLTCGRTRTLIFFF